jgi:hypothetical protein
VPRKRGQHKSPHPWQGEFRRRGAPADRLTTPAIRALESAVLGRVGMLAVEASENYDVDGERALVESVRAGNTLGVHRDESTGE